MQPAAGPQATAPASQSGPAVHPRRAYPPPQAATSYTGRVAPRVALLAPELVDRNVVLRVLRWAGLGDGGGGGGGGDELAEDAA